MHKNELKVKFKNAVMQVWTQIKRETMPKDMSSLIQEMLERKQKRDERDGLNNLGIDGDHDKGTEDKQLEIESKTSIFTLE